MFQTHAATLDTFHTHINQSSETLLLKMWDWQHCFLRHLQQTLYCIEGSIQPKPPSALLPLLSESLPKVFFLQAKEATTQDKRNCWNLYNQIYFLLYWVNKQTKTIINGRCGYRNAAWQLEKPNRMQVIFLQKAILLSNSSDAVIYFYKTHWQRSAIFFLKVIHSSFKIFLTFIMHTNLTNWGYIRAISRRKNRAESITFWFQAILQSYINPNNTVLAQK